MLSILISKPYKADHGTLTVTTTGGKIPNLRAGSTTSMRVISF